MTDAAKTAIAESMRAMKVPPQCPGCGAGKISPLSSTYKCWSTWVLGKLFTTVYCKGK